MNNKCINQRIVCQENILSSGLQGFVQSLSYSCLSDSLTPVNTAGNHLAAQRYILAVQRSQHLSGSFLVKRARWRHQSVRLFR